MKQFFLIILLGTTGCMTTYHVSVDSLASRPTKGATVFVETALGSSSSALERDFYSSYATAALALAGYKPVGLDESPEYVVSVQFGMTSETQISSKPTFQWEGPKSYNFNAQTQNAYGSKLTTTGRVSETGFGQLKQTGSRVESYNVFNRALILTCYKTSEVMANMKADKGMPNEVWITKIFSSGTSDDLRGVMPIMLTGGIKHFGQSTDSKQEYRFYEADRRLTEAAKRFHEAKLRAPASIP